MGPKIIRNSKVYDHIQEGERFFLEQIEKVEALEGWTVYEQPHLNGDRPDFVLCHPEKGVVIVEVKDWSLDSTNYRPIGKVLGADGQWIDKNPINQIKRYKDNLLQFISRKYVAAVEQFNKTAYAIVEPVIYFHNALVRDARDFCGNQEGKVVKIIDRSHVEAIGMNRLDEGGIRSLTIKKSLMVKNDVLPAFVQDLQMWLNPSDYHIERQEPIKLFPDQERYVKVQPGSYRRLKGVAGSGKSLILATKAARMLKQSYRVLILTYNITLRHYLRDLVSQQFGVGDRTLIRDELVISHFHHFLKQLANNYGIELPYEDDDDDFELRWIEVINERISKIEIDHNWMFDAILIDEGQDFKKQWVQFLKTFFTGKAEFFIFYDIDQDLYGRQKDVWIEESKEIKGLGFRGRPGHLNITRRLPGSIVQLISLLREYFGEQRKQEILIPYAQLDFFTKASWKNVSELQEKKSKFVYDELQSLLQQGAKIDDIAILTTHEETGVEIVKELGSKGFSVSHVYDLSGTKNIDNRRREKWKFQPGDARLKVCTVHSFKGWEASHVIFVLDRPKKSKEIVDSMSSSAPSLCFQNNQQSLDVNVGKDEKEGENRFDAKIGELLFIALSRVRYHEKMNFCSFTCLNFIPKYNELQKIFN
ncbi:nuclease-related domain-containing DEAD/DEAH box helicase [Anoxybacillus sp. MB8]|uniref:nuclease-related domain-containing DEAD/DEAH box helicase n=1 Tax=Anoxybacillus sp. MB8 TaxID=2496850 RepID=UPI0013D79564|nr:NERD domain-containing protein/DEAD/DEAH box helicase [Anoxybacillus sp. MB8]